MQPQLSVLDAQERETQRRIAAARAAGWDEQTIQRNAMIDRALRSQQQQATAQQTIQQKPKASGLKRTLVNLGAFGANIGAGVLGAAFAVPTFGTSVAGAFGAGAGIEALRRKMLGEDQSLGASVLEGGLAALPGVGKGIGLGVKALKGANAARAVAATTNVAGTAASALPTTTTKATSMRALAKKASQSAASSNVPASNAITNMRPAARGFTSSLDAQKYAKFDDFYKDYGTFFKEQGFTRGDANKIFQAAQRMPMGGLSSSTGGAVGLRPQASIQSQIEAAHNAGNKAVEMQLVSQLPAAEQATMRSALGLPKASVAPISQAVTPTAAKMTPLQTAAQAFRSNPGKASGGLIKGGEHLKAQARGVVPGLKPQGSAERLLPSEATKINETLNQIGAKGAVPRQLRTVEAAQQKAIGQIDSELNRFDVSLSQTARNNIASKFEQNIASASGGTGLLPMASSPANSNMKQFVSEVSQRIKGATTIKQQEQLRRAIDSRINFARNPASPDPIGEEVFKIARRTLDDSISAVTPGLKAAKTQYAALEAAKDALVMNTPATLRQAAGQGLIGRLMAGGPAQKAIDVTGRAVAKTGRIASLPAVKVGAAQQAGRILFKEPDAKASAQGLQLGDTGLEQPQLEQPDMTGSGGDEQAMINQMLSSGFSEDEVLNALGGGMQGGAMASMGGSGITERDSATLLKDALATYQAGNPEGAKFLMSLAQQTAALEGQRGSTAGGMNADQRKAMGKVDTAENIANQIEQLLGTVGGGQGWKGYITQIGAKLPGVASNEKAYEAIRRASIAPLARAISGEVGVLTDRDIARVEALLPRLNDTPAEAQMKLANLRFAIQERRADISNLGGSAPDQSSSSLGGLSDNELLSMLSQGSYGF